MKKNAAFYWKLFSSTFLISAFTFGGGFVIVPLLRKKFVEHYGWLEEEEMLDLTAIAQSSPGAIAVNASILIGYRLAGLFGALLTILGTVLPPLLILTGISFFYEAFRTNIYVQGALRGMQAAVAAILFDVVISMAAAVMKKRKLLPVIVMLAAFVAAYFLQVNLMLIILFCAVLGAATVWIQEKQGRGERI